jgi:hypothetical protein
MQKEFSGFAGLKTSEEDWEKNQSGDRGGFY